MAVTPEGNNLVFIISQPRSGSTLLQKILGSHTDISTSVEPWLLLPLVYILKESGVRGEYNALNASINTLEFLDSVPSGRKHYLDGVRKMMSEIYNAAMTDGSRYFLDKTPRYYLIVKELADLFPAARFVFLYRNPLSVLASMHSSWGSILGLLNSNVKTDLLKAPGLLVEGKELLGERAISIHYENLVSQPEKTIESICNFLGISFQPEMIRYGRGNTEKWSLGDQKTVYENESPVTTSIDKWINYIQTAQNWRYADGYLRILGPDIISRLGYSCDELVTILDSNKPPLYFRLFTFPLLSSMYIHYFLRKIYRLVLLKDPL